MPGTVKLQHHFHSLPLGIVSWIVILIDCLPLWLAWCRPKHRSVVRNSASSDLAPWKVETGRRLPLGERTERSVGKARDIPGSGLALSCGAGRGWPIFFHK